MAASDPASKENQRAEAYFQTAQDAAMKENYDYAIRMLQDACKLVPGHLTYRQTLRGVQRRKFGNEPAKVGRLVGTTRVRPIRLRAGAAKAKGQWASVLEVLEEAFNYNPWDVGTAMDAAEAAEKLGFADVAVWLLESVYVQAGDNLDYLRHLALLLEQNTNYHKAIHIWERVKRLAPHDEDATRKINALSAAATIVRSGLNEALDRHTNAAQQEALMAEAEELRPQKMTHEEMLLKEINDEPTRVRAYLELSELYRKQGKLDEAEKVLSRGRAAMPEENLIQEAHSDVQILRLDRAIEAWKRKLQADPDDPNARAKLDRLIPKRTEYELEEFRRRVALRPEDAHLHYELGTRLAQAGKHDEAIKEFQVARNAPDVRARALLQAGLSFEAKGILKLAERSYHDALKAIEPSEQAMFNQLHYRLGRVAEAMGSFTTAEEHYNEVAANDYSYLDVAKRLEDLGKRPPE